MSVSENATIAALDIGTNSFHLVIAKVVEGGFEVIETEKETVRIGHGAGDMNELSADAIDRGIACLVRMQKIAASHNAEIRAVATSAIREAKNRFEFIRRAKKEAQIDIEVISGVEEARLIHLGALHGVGGQWRIQRKRPDAWAVNWEERRLLIMEFTRPNYRGGTVPSRDRHTEDG